MYPSHAFPKTTNLIALIHLTFQNILRADATTYMAELVTGKRDWVGLEVAYPEAAKQLGLSIVLLEPNDTLEACLLIPIGNTGSMLQLVFSEHGDENFTVHEIAWAFDGEVDGLSTPVRYSPGETASDTSIIVLKDYLTHMEPEANELEALRLLKDLAAVKHLPKQVRRHLNFLIAGMDFAFEA